VIKACDLDPEGVDVRQLIDLDVQSWTQLNRAMIRFIHDVRSRVQRMAIISNMTQTSLVWIRRQFDWLALFDECVYSCEFGVNKPDAAIYRECTRRLGLQASECLFVDDSAENVRGARHVGMAAIQFEDVTQFLAELKAYPLAQG
jgi:epoxide hydrolase-like predicted phosphatase